MNRKSSEILSLAIPQTLSEITPAWLTGVLTARHPGIVVTRAEVSGFLGHKPNKCRVRVEYNEAGRAAGLPASLFVKGGFKGTNNAAESGLAAGLDVGTELELQAYIELVPQVDVTTPSCYAVAFDAPSYTGIAVMEDLAASGAIFLSDAPHLNYVQAVAFVKALGRLHAPWFNGPALGANGEFGPNSALAERTRRLHALYFDQMASRVHWDAYMRSPRGAAVPRQLQDVDRFAAGQKAMHQIHRTVAKTIIHGDEHLGNLYTLADGTPGFFDWCARIEPWAIGFTYFLIVTLDSLDRRAWERALLQIYLDTLEQHGARAPGFEEAWFIYRCTIVYPTLAWLVNSAKFQPESINTRNAARGALAMLDHDVFALLGV